MNLLQSVRIKLFLQNTIFLFLNVINKLKRHDSKCILLYINTDLRESNKTVLDYMLANGYNRNYRIVCACNNPQDYKDCCQENVVYTGRFGGVLSFFRASKVFYSIGKIPIIPSKDQVVMQMWHGTPLKGTNEGWRKNHTWKRQHYTYLLSTSKHFAPIFSEMFSVPLEKIYIGGYPRCDALFEKGNTYDFGDYKKLILWTPTFRKSLDRGLKELSDSKIVVPVLSPEIYATFDEFLGKLGIKVVVKLHPLQDLGGFTLKKMNNFILLTHGEFLNRKMDLYRLCAQSDALITDYSSIYFDYLLLNRPIAFTEDDLQDYQDGRGFAMKNPDDYKPGCRIKNESELMDFCEKLAAGIDGYEQERDRVCKLAYDFREGGYCKRILDFMGITQQ